MTGISRWIQVIPPALLFCLSLTAAADARDTEAYAARPFGVGRITLPLDAEQAALLDSNAFQIVERDNRVLYPAFVSGRLAGILNSLLGTEGTLLTPRLTVYFLFRGDDPLDITLLTPTARQVKLVPQRPDGGDGRTAVRINRVRDRLFADWWRRYNEAAMDQVRRNDYPPVLQHYLLTMLSKRLGVAPPPTMRQYWAGQRLTPPQETLDLLLGTDKMRAAVMRESLLGAPSGRAPATLPVPQDITWQPAAIPPADPAVAIEPLAMHVPVDCFYIHYGRFNNYLWMEFLLEDYGGEFARMVTLRSHNPGKSDRFQNQLGLERSALAEIFGEQAIADVAVIGRDLFLGEGAAMGILFQARNNILLGADLQQQRAAATKALKDYGATSDTVKIAGRDVSFAYTPDNRLRSFYAVDGDFHLVTTSRRIVEEFYAAGAGNRSLGQSPGFRYARTIMPKSREDTVFVYMSPQFFQGLLSPQYRIELRRRLQAVTDMELIQLANLAATAEAAPHDSLDDLIAGGFLPKGFDQRSDGSGPVWEHGNVVDSLRGGRGTFTPVPDVHLKAITPQESSDYAEVSLFHSKKWQQMDPLVIGIKRYALNDSGLERIVFDAWVTPFVPDKYGWVTSIVGPPVKNRVSDVPGDIVSAQGVVRGGLLLPSAGMHHVYFGVQDSEPVVDLSRGGLLTWIRFVQTAPCYFGAWPKPGYLDMLPFGLAPKSDEFGYARLLFGLWRRQWRDFSTFSFHQPLLAHVTEHHRTVEADFPAQLRVRVGDLSNARITSTTSAIAYQRAKQASMGNTRFLHMLSQQLHVPRPHALDAAEQLLNTQLVCTLGGKYQLAEYPSGLQLWISTAWAEDRGATEFTIPEGYTSPLLEWFRGVNATAVMQDDEFLVHAELDMQRKKRDAPKIKLPEFDFGKLWKGALPQKRDGDAKKPEGSPEEVPKPSEKPGTGPREF
jgi:hypothetical protein